MGTPNVGWGAGVIGLALETGDYGTAVARTNWLEVESCTIKREIGREQVHTMGSGTEKDMTPRASVITSHRVRGQIVWHPAYDDSTIFLLYHALGKKTESGTAAPYTHTLETAMPSVWPQSFCLERAFGNRAGTKDAEVYTGCRITRLTLTWAEEGRITATADILGHDSAGRTTLGTPSLHSGEPDWIMSHHLGNLTWSSIADKTRGGTLTVDRKLDFSTEAGSIYGALPLPTGFQDITLQVRRFYDETTAYSDFLANTFDSLSMTFDTGGNDTLAIAFGDAELSQYTDDVSGPGMSEYQATFRAHGTTTAAAIVATVTNGNALTTTN